MRERYFRIDKLVVVFLWVVVFKVSLWTCIAALLGWIHEDTVRVAMVAMFPLTGLAVVLHVRLYAVRMCGMIRAAAADREYGRSVTPLRR